MLRKEKGEGERANKDFIRTLGRKGIGRKKASSKGNG